MPKGALLHAHLDATVNARVLLDLALKYPTYHVKTNTSLTADNLISTLPQFSPLPQSKWTEDSSLTAATYEPGTWVSLHKARENFAFGGPEAFDRWVIGSMTISPSEAYKTHNTTVKVGSGFHFSACMHSRHIYLDMGQVLVDLPRFRCKYRLLERMERCLFS